MSHNLAEQIRALGFAVVPGALADHPFDDLDSEFASLLVDRSQTWADADRLAASATASTSTREVLLALAERPGFDLALLEECDITLDHRPFAVLRPDSPVHVGQALCDLVSAPGLLDLVEEVIGPRITLSPNGHVRFKLPSSDGRGATPWHRDAMTHVPSSDPVTVLTCWVPMHDVSEDEGCLLVVPEGHVQFRDLMWPLTPAVVDQLERRAIPLPVRRGDVVVLDKHVPHASMPNCSATARWSLDLRYYPTGQPSDRPWYPALEVRRPSGAEPPEVEVAQWRRRWEETRSRFVASGQLVPGRPDYARVVAEQHISEWAAQ